LPSTATVNNGSAFDIALVSDTTSAACVLDIYNPQVALKTQTSGNGSDSRTGGVGALVSGGMLDNTTAYDGFTIFSSATFTNINLTVYGYRIA
jgi:hypothetical protein